eukprot:tig00000655_g2871.t1
MGLHSALFLDAPPEDYTCNICIDVLGVSSLAPTWGSRYPTRVVFAFRPSLRCRHSPVEACSRHHRFCRRCLRKWLQVAPSCPSCRQPLQPEEPLRPLPELQAAIGRLRIRCKRADLGCGWTGVLSERQRHDEECPWLPVSCPHGDGTCGRIVRSELPQHLLRCTERPVVCPFCQERLRSRQCAEHNRVCALRPGPCANAIRGCTARVCLRELPQHRAVCPYEPLPCPNGAGECGPVLRVHHAEHGVACGRAACAYAADGCLFRGTRDAVEAHRVACPSRTVHLARLQGDRVDGAAAALVREVERSALRRELAALLEAERRCAAAARLREEELEAGRDGADEAARAAVAGAARDLAHTRRALRGRWRRRWRASGGTRRSPGGPSPSSPTTLLRALLLPRERTLALGPRRPAPGDLLLPLPPRGASPPPAPPPAPPRARRPRPAWAPAPASPAPRTWTPRPRSAAGRRVAGAPAPRTARPRPPPSRPRPRRRRPRQSPSWTPSSGPRGLPLLAAPAARPSPTPSSLLRTRPRPVPHPEPPEAEGEGEDAEEWRGTPVAGSLAASRTPSQRGGAGQPAAAAAAAASPEPRRRSARLKRVLQSIGRGLSRLVRDPTRRAISLSPQPPRPASASVPSAAGSPSGSAWQGGAGVEGATSGQPRGRLLELEGPAEARSLSPSLVRAAAARPEAAAAAPPRAPEPAAAPRGGLLRAATFSPQAASAGAR